MIDAAGPPERESAHDVRLLQLDLVALRALSSGDLAAARRATPVELTAYLVGPECRGVWQRRALQVADDPRSAAWVTGLVLDERLDQVVGRAGFHGPPDGSGMVEVGYAIDPAYRRRGYARAALRCLLTRALADPQVSVVRATVSPDNAGSRGLVLSHGFIEVGEQWDDEDGREIVYEVAAAGPCADGPAIG